MAIKVDRPRGREHDPAGGVTMPAIATPTADDALGVDPICTNDPVCSLHDITVGDALDAGGPFGLARRHARVLLDRHLRTGARCAAGGGRRPPRRHVPPR